MSTPKSSLIAKLRGDYTEAQIEAAQAEERWKLTRWKVQYIKTLLDSAEAEESTGEFAGLTIAEVAVAVLRGEGKPMSAMDIARQAVAGGFAAENLERARSHFSAVISKDINGPKPKFRQVDRGAIGLVEWPKEGPPAEDEPTDTLRKLTFKRMRHSSQLAPPEQEKPKDDDCPF